MVTFSGVGSGLDLSSLVDSIVAAERLPITKLNERKAVATARISTLGNLVTKMQALATKAKELDATTELHSLKVVSSAENRVTATATNEATPTNYNVRVHSLAAAQSNKSTAFLTSDAQPGGGTLTIGVGADEPIEVSFDGSMSLQDIATQINDSDARVKAIVLNDGTGYRLLVTGEEAGTDNAITYGGDGAAVLGLDGASLVRPAASAVIEVDGLFVTRNSNRISDLFEGVTLDLHSVTPAIEAEATIAVEEDRASTRDKLQGFVDSYNEMSKILTGELSKNGTDVSKAQMLGDATLRGLQRRLGSIVGGGYAHGAESVALGSVGITLARDGSLSIDAAKFDKAVAADPSALSDLFAGGGATNLSTELSNLVEAYTASTTGILTSKRSGLESRVDAFEEQIDKVEARATKVGDRMRKTFTALDSVVSALQTQQSQLMAALYGTAG